MLMARGRFAALVLIVAVSGCGYNRIQQMDDTPPQLKANIDAELMRRNDLIPNLVATVELAANFDKQTYTQVAEARSGLTAAREQLASAVGSNAGTAQVAAADAAVSSQLRTFLNVSVEAYPSLRANENFSRLQDELTETENRIAVARKDYNEGVQAYNAYIRQFPQAITAKVTGAQRKDPFEGPAGAQQAPRVVYHRFSAGGLRRGRSAGRRAAGPKGPAALSFPASVDIVT
jgi:LemA protein